MEGHRGNTFLGARCSILTVSGTPVTKTVSSSCFPYYNVWGIHGCTEVHVGIKGYTWVLRGIRGYTWVLRGIHWFIGVYKGVQGYIGFTGVYTWYAWE